MPEMTRISHMDLDSAFEWVSAAPPHGNSAFISRQTGQVFCKSMMYDSPDEMPDDIDDVGSYLAVPHKNDLDLGRELVLRFIDDTLSDDYDEVRHFFSKRGAYGRFKNLLERRGRLDAWHEYERRATDQALLQWAREHDLQVTDRPAGLRDA
jgi:hypothetical protein